MERMMEHRMERVALGPMPTRRRMITLDEQIVRAPVGRIFELARDVERWPTYLPHYRYVRFGAQDGHGGGIVDMSANRPFGPVGWPTYWRSLMEVRPEVPVVRFRHVAGITTGMDVEWSFEPIRDGTHVRILHVWNGPGWPLIGHFAATVVIGPVFVHGIASRTLAGLARVAEEQ